MSLGKGNCESVKEVDAITEVERISTSDKNEENAEKTNLRNVVRNTGKLETDIEHIGITKAGGAALCGDVVRRLILKRMEENKDARVELQQMVSENLAMPKENIRLRLDNYRIEGMLGRGAFGKIWKATHANGEKVALKQVKVTGQGIEDVWKERIVMATLTNPRIIKFLGAFYETDAFFVVEQCIGDVHHLNPQIDRINAVRFSIHLLQGVEYMHLNRILHRDIKPENCLITTTQNLVISDFGAAVKLPEDKNKIQCTRIFGNAGYSDLDALKNFTYSFSSDIFGAAATIYELTTKHCLLAYGGVKNKKPDMALYLSAYEQGRRVGFGAAVEAPKGEWPREPLTERVLKSPLKNVLTRMIKEPGTCRPSATEILVSDDLLTVLQEYNVTVDTVDDIEFPKFGKEPFTDVTAELRTRNRESVCNEITFEECLMAPFYLDCTETKSDQASSPMRLTLENEEKEKSLHLAVAELLRGCGLTDAAIIANQLDGPDKIKTLLRILTLAGELKNIWPIQGQAPQHPTITDDVCANLGQNFEEIRRNITTGSAEIISVVHLSEAETRSLKAVSPHNANKSAERSIEIISGKQARIGSELSEDENTVKNCKEAVKKGKEFENAEKKEEKEQISQAGSPLVATPHLKADKESSRRIIRLGRVRVSKSVKTLNGPVYRVTESPSIKSGKLTKQFPDKCGETKERNLEEKREEVGKKACAVTSHKLPLKQKDKNAKRKKDDFSEEESGEEDEEKLAKKMKTAAEEGGDKEGGKDYGKMLELFGISNGSFNDDLLNYLVNAKKEAMKAKKGGNLTQESSDDESGELSEVARGEKTTPKPQYKFEKPKNTPVKIPKQESKKNVEETSSVHGRTTEKNKERRIKCKYCGVFRHVDRAEVVKHQKICIMRSSK